MHVTAGRPFYSNAVDLYNSATGAWSTAQLSVARGDLAATSVGNIAIFAGGSNGGGTSLQYVVRGAFQLLLHLRGALLLTLWFIRYDVLPCQASSAPLQVVRCTMR
jgi:hypothetical protein